MKIKVDRGRLLDKLRANREQHKRDFLESLEGYREKLADFYREALAKLERGEVPKRTYPTLQEPRSYTDDYDRAIEMLEFAEWGSSEVEGVEPIIELDEADFRRLVNDEWDWAQQFRTTTQFYKGG